MMLPYLIQIFVIFTNFYFYFVAFYSKTVMLIKKKYFYSLIIFYVNVYFLLYN